MFPFLTFYASNTILTLLLIPLHHLFSFPNSIPNPTYSFLLHLQFYIFPMGDAMELEPKSSNSHFSSSTNLHLCSQIFLRALVISSTLAATLLIISAKQSVLILGIPFDARYTYSSAFVFFALANAISCAFSFLSACLVFISIPRLASGNNNHGTRNRNYYIFFLHDLLMMGLLLAGCSAATAIGCVGKYGNDHTGWSPICDHFPKFCDRVTASLAISYFSVLCLLILTILSANPPLTSC
ncbi:CASP-like protein 1F2 [Benincasa hispida]|uniref:CASP-like protein 1F2 n=1 Tax=Benincasa hispida TaxID=102211 RepID=UPI0018FF4EEB|nr:CASP-like protein 1F2 [Benincasa hispida]